MELTETVTIIGNLTFDLNLGNQSTWIWWLDETQFLLAATDPTCYPMSKDTKADMETVLITDFPLNDNLI
jgi:hypothetical protein